MLKYIKDDVSVVFEEIPDEITLAVNISNCQNRCVGCHSPYLRDDIGDELDYAAIDRLIVANDGITCFCFMGEGNDKEALIACAAYVLERYPRLKVGVYVGRDVFDECYRNVFDYIKVGSYRPECGPLNNPKTNQRLYRKTVGSDGTCVFEDITYRFWKKE